MILLLWRRKWLSLKNSVLFLTPYEWVRNAAFGLAGLGLLLVLHYGFVRLLAYLNTVPLIGGLLLWKLTAMMMLATFVMTVISSLLTSLSTLYFSYDLRFLMKAPLPLRTVFADKSLESAFFASWMIGLVLFPYVAALVRVNGYGLGFLAAFTALLGPFLLLAASFGIAFTLVILYLFPTSRTRDAIWMLSSLSLTLVYGLIRFSQPERLIRPDALGVVADYLRYLQAPTAPYLPSWWLTRALASWAAGRRADFWPDAALLVGAAAAAYALLIWAAGRLYFRGYSGAQEGGRRSSSSPVEPLPEGRWLAPLGMGPALCALFWKERVGFFRDVKHWSQILLVAGLVFVYLFSISRLPLDHPDLKSLVSFLNVGTAGFVIAALGLRFTFPSISLEGRSWWVVRAAPIDLGDLMWQKFIFSALPMTAIALVLALVTNRLLDADAFTSWLSLVSLLVATWAICAMGIGLGALFPMFAVENIHQIESSLGGFVYMAASLTYVGLTIMILSWPMQMHFQQRFGKADAWSLQAAGLCAGSWLILNALAFLVPWMLGRRTLESFES